VKGEVREGDRRERESERRKERRNVEEES